MANRDNPRAGRSERAAPARPLPDRAPKKLTEAARPAQPAKRKDNAQRRFAKPARPKADRKR
ncbi:MAG TPA: hypothetical protein VNZ57_02435 [Longimicrobiales bacterium]|nr:hypothetical protein [Longimicrobiales bacterium]